MNIFTFYKFNKFLLCIFCTVDLTLLRGIFLKSIPLHNIHKMSYNENIPFILRYFYQDIKSVYGSITNVSAVCKKCSKTFQGELYSPTAFESHLKSVNHDGLHEEYLKLRPQHSTETKNQTKDGPIVSLFKSLITNDYKQNTVLSNTYITDILEQEFFIDVKNTHELEVEIYLNVIKKYLKDWPEWEDFEQAASDLNLKDDSSVELLRKNHIKLKDYLFGILEIAKIMAPEATKKIKNPKEKVSEDSLGKSDVVMEINATKLQLNNLILRCPRNNNIFNVNKPDIQCATPRKVCLESIINSCGFTIEMTLKHSKSRVLHFKYVNLHTIGHNLVNKKLNAKRQITQLQQEWQVKYRKKSKNGDLFKEAIPNLLHSYNLSGDRVKWRKLFVSMHKIWNNITQNMPTVIDSSADYKKHLSHYTYVRYFYNNPHDDEVADYKHDIQLEEVITPTCLMSINCYPKGDHEDSVSIQCDTCQMSFSGFDVLPDLEQHVADCHDPEPDWSCSNCNQTMDVLSLTKRNWYHKCPDDVPVGSSTIQTTNIL